MESQSPMITTTATTFWKIRFTSEIKILNIFFILFLLCIILCYFGYLCLGIKLFI